MTFDDVDRQSFDPYSTWLNISVANRPPTWFDLLGLPLTVADSSIITKSYQKRKQRVTSELGGTHDAAAVQIFPELEEAYRQLLDPVNRTNYRNRITREYRLGKLYHSQGYRSFESQQAEKKATSQLDLSGESTRVMIGLLSILAISIVISVLVSWGGRFPEDVPAAQAEIETNADVEANLRLEPNPSLLESNSSTTVVASAKEASKEQVDEDTDHESAKSETAWTDLFERFSTSTNAVRGYWARAGEAVKGDARGTSFAGIRLPLENNNFELEVDLEMTARGQYPGVLVIFPIGFSRAEVSFWFPDWLELKRVTTVDPLSELTNQSLRAEGRDLIRNSIKVGSYKPDRDLLGFSHTIDGQQLQIDRYERCTLSVKVSSDKSNATIEVGMNGDTIFKWTGKSNQLRLSEEIPQHLLFQYPRSSLFLACSSGTAVTFHSARVRPLTD